MADAPGRPRVLVVEDDPAVRSLWVAVLDDLGCTVAAVGDGADALRQMETFRPQLILLDLVMPQAQMDGFDVLMRIEEFRVPVIVVSALGDALRATISPRVAAVLSKPVAVYDLIREVNRLLASTSSAV